MNNKKVNVFIKKINNDSEELFDKCIPILNSERNVKEAFYHFMYHDLIKVDKNGHNINTIEVEELINSPSNISDDYLETTYSNISNNNSNLTEIIRSNILKKKNGN